MRRCKEKMPQFAYMLYQAHLVQQRPRVLLAESDFLLRRVLAVALCRDGFDVIEARDSADLRRLIGEEIFQRKEKPGVDLIVADLQMSGASGLKALAHLRRREWATPLLVLTASGDAGTYREAHRLGVAGIFDKPFDLDDFRTAVINLIR
jgi:two-component system, response regulator, stage 0 sporulation protein F